MKNKALLPILAGFFVMGFCDIIGTVMNQVKEECGLSDLVAGFLPLMIFIWFFLVSIPAGILSGRIGRKNAVLVSLAVTVVAKVSAARCFPWCMGLAINKVPEKANEIASLMVMAIVGGGLVTPLLGFAQGRFGATGILTVLIACLAYLFVLGLGAGGKEGRKGRNA